MKLSRIRQLRTILREELAELQHNDCDLTRRRSSHYIEPNYDPEIFTIQGPSSEDHSHASSENEQSDVEIPNLEAWSNLGVAASDDFPQTVSFHLGSMGFTYPIEEVVLLSTGKA
jgi:hypothetical protein